MGLATTDTLTNKTLTDPVLNGTLSGTAFLDEDDMASDSAIAVASQQSIKKYVDDKVTAEDLDFAGDSGTGSVDLDSETLTIDTGANLTTAASSQTLTVNLDTTITGLTSVTSTDFVGDVTGDVSGNADTATQIYVTDNESTDENNLIAFIEDTGSVTPPTDNHDLQMDGDLYYNPSESKLTVPNVAADVTGALTGNASTATALETPRTIGGTSFDGTASIVPATVTVADTTGATCSVGLFESATGDLGPKSDAGLTYNAATGMLTATGLTGPLTGNAATATLAATVTTNANLSGDVTSSGNTTSITAGVIIDTDVKSDAAIAYSKLGTIPTWNQSTTGNAATATLASTVTVTDNASGEADRPVVFNVGSDAFENHTATFAYKPSTGTVAATIFSGALSGNATTATTATTVTTNADLTGDVTSSGSNATTLGTVAVTKGGTNITSYAVGDILYANTTTTLAKLAASTDGYVLTATGAGTAPAWEEASGGGAAIGTAVTSATEGSILFAGADGGSGGVLAQDNANLFWDNATDQLILGTGSASSPSLTFNGDAHTGIWSHADNTITFVAGGAYKAWIGDSSLYMYVPVLGPANSGSYGDAAAPSFAFTDDTDTGMFNSAEDELGFSVGGVEKVRIDSAGLVGIGTSSPGDYYPTELVVDCSDEGGITVVSATGETAYLMFAEGTSGAERYRGYVGIDHGTGKFYVYSAGIVSIYAGGVEKMTITSAGEVGIGTTEPSADLSVVGQIQQNVQTTTSTEAGSVSFEVDFSKTNLQTLVLDAADTDLTLTTTSATTGKTVRLYVENPGGLSEFSYPGGWQTFGVDPSSLSGYNFIVELTCWGSGDSTITADITEAIS